MAAALGNRRGSRRGRRPCSGPSAESDAPLGSAPTSARVPVQGAPSPGRLNTPKRRARPKERAPPLCLGCSRLATSLPFDYPQADRAAADWDAAWAAAIGHNPPEMKDPPSAEGGAVATAAPDGTSPRSPPQLTTSGCGSSSTTATTLLTASDWQARGVVAATLQSRDRAVLADDEDEDEDEEEEGEEEVRARARVGVGVIRLGLGLGLG